MRLHNFFFTALQYVIAPFRDAFFLKKKASRTKLFDAKPCEVLFITVAFNNLDVLILQCELMRRCINNSYIHIIVDNSPTRKQRENIEKICAQYKVDYYGLPKNPWTGKHNSRSHGLALNWVCRNVLHKYKAKVVGILDHDVFPIIPHNIITSMKEKQFMGVLQELTGVWYLWPGFFFWKTSSLLNCQLDFSPTRTGDTGSALWKKIFTHMHKNNITQISEQELPLRKGHIRQSSCYYKLDKWIHTVNASYWTSCLPKEESIINVLQKETGFTDLFEFLETIKSDLPCA